MDLRAVWLLVVAAVLACGCRAEAPTPLRHAVPSRPDAASSPSDALPVGAAPRVAYAVAEHATFGGGDWQLVRPDGSRQPLPHPPGQFVAYADRVVNGYATEGGYVVEVVDRRGREVGGATGLCAFGLVTGARHRRVAWLDGRSLVTLDDGRDPTRTSLRLPPLECGRLVPVALASGRLLVNARRRSAPYALAPGRRPRALSALRLVRDVGPGRLVGLLQRPRGCSVLADLHGQRLWENCDHRLLELSTDGRHVLGIRGPGGHGRTRAVSIFTDAGELEAQWLRPAGATIEEVCWEDDDHVLAVVHEPAGWSLVRLGVDGSVEQAVAPLPVEAVDSRALRLPIG